MLPRTSGILFPIFSLASKYGIGCFSKEAREFVDFLKEAGQAWWQILPIGPTGYGNSPYQPDSAYAGNPYFICLEELIEKKYLTEEEVNEVSFGDDLEKVDYGAMYENRKPLLKKAFERWKEAGDDKAEYDRFLEKESFWLGDYALYIAIKEAQKGVSWLDWPKEFCSRDKDALLQAQKDYKETIDFVCFEQFLFQRQWNALVKYAHKQGVGIIGDLPFYVALDSADAWSHPEVFCTDTEGKPSEVAGCPPDAFSATGQLWGNPVYDWEANKKSGYVWWIQRIKRNYEFYDVIRFDHFHGFCQYYSIPWGEEDGRKGKYYPGPGMDFFNALKSELKELRMIAEDLGTVTEENTKLLKDSGLPGMKVLQFAFTSWDSVYVNHRHENNCVVYTGTHDNTPTRAWVEEIGDGDRSYVRRYINSMNSDYGQLVWDIIREAYRSVADLCIIPLQDYLCKGKEARINTPGKAEGNWQWRLLPNFLSPDLSRSIRDLADLYGRTPRESLFPEPEEEEAENAAKAEGSV